MEATLPQYQPFSARAMNVLNAIYASKNVAPEDTSGKISALRDHVIKEEMLVASTDGILDDEAELRALEHYVLNSLDVEA